MTGSIFCNLRAYGGVVLYFFFFQAEDGIRDLTVTGVQTCALPISSYDLFGFKGLAKFVPCCSTNRLTLAFSAVLPLPKRSYEAPIRGDRSFHLDRKSVV